MKNIIILSEFVLAICILGCSGFSPMLPGQPNPEAVAAIKELSAEIDRYTENRGGPDYKFIAGLLSNKSWEWIENKSEDEKKAFFERFEEYQGSWVWLRDSRVVCATFTVWNDTNDWVFFLKYHFDDLGRIMQISAEYRSLSDYIKVCDFQYFDKSGKVLDHAVEYYALGWGGDKQLPEKPETMQSPIRKIPVYLKASDLPYYSLLSSKLFRDPVWE